MKVTLVRHTDRPLEAIAEAAAICYDSVPSNKIVNHCYSAGHTSVFEFADFHFLIEGVSRALSHQLVRHRMASYTQRSQRYVMEDGFRAVTPPIANEIFLERFDVTLQQIDECYRTGINNNVLPEDARYILPNACLTSLHVKMNMRSLMNFFNLRLCTRAQWEIRLLAIEMNRIVLQKCPECAPYFVPKCEVHAPFNFCTEKHTCGLHPLLKEVYKK